MTPESVNRKYRLIVFVIAVIAVSGQLAKTAYSQGTDCVDCDKQKSQLNGHGAHSSTDPRRVINVKIEGTWGAPTNANIWNATTGDVGNGALEMWNAQGSPYYFDIRQDVPASQTDFLIVKDPTWNFADDGCAMTSTPTAGSGRTTRVVHLPPQAANWNQDTLACIVAHEIGHGIGLSGSFPPCQSIMTEPPVRTEADCKCSQSITQNDVAKTNQFAENAAANCGKQGKRTNFGTPTGGVTDPNPFRYNPTCYYFYEAVDVYYCRWISITDGSCHPDTPPEYIGTIYVLTDYYCF